jgi:hypothetical protein
MNAKGDKAMKGYKGFDNDLKCRGFQYEVGKSYECEGKIEICSNGFHFCKEPKQIYGYYGDLTSCRYCEVEASGEIIEGDGKCVCSEIKIVREIPLQEFLALVNEGSINTGWANEGNWNKGDSNVGNGNKGNSNKGDSNEGDSNKGDLNEGDGNEGNCNKGDWNKGDGNEGNCNKGDWNKGDGNEGNYNIGSYNRGNDLCGLFNTDGGCVIFNKYTPTKHTEIKKMKGYSLLAECIFEKKLPEKEELEEIKKLPNFDEAVMRELILGKESKK